MIYGMTTQYSPDFSAVAARARDMSLVELVWHITDCKQAAHAARDMERAGCRVSKTEGYYLDECGVYYDELRKRELKALSLKLRAWDEAHREVAQ